MSEQMSNEQIKNVLDNVLDEITELKVNNKEQEGLIRDLTGAVIKLDQMMQQYELMVKSLYVELTDVNRQLRVAENYNHELIKKQQESRKQGEPVRFMGKGAVYQAVIGGYDDIQEIQYKNPNLDYILFTDNPDVKSLTWQVRLIEKPEELSNVQLARRIKILGHEYLPEYDYSIWVDGKLEILDDLECLVRTYRNKEPILAFPHYEHDCVYLEEQLCEELGKGNIADMRRQVEWYRQEGYPAHNGMVDSCVLVREYKNPAVIRTMETWWQQIIQYSTRDQLSFGYACWKTHMAYDLVPLYCYQNIYFKSHGHK